MKKRKAKTKPYLTNSIIASRRGDEGKALIQFDSDGRALLYIDRYLIAPREMFTERQIAMAMKRYHNAGEI